MKYLAIPILGLVFALSFAYTTFAAEPTVCTMQYAPVCASKQVQCIRAPCYPVYQTYGNACMAAADKATVIHQGECTATETGPIKPSTEAYKPPAGCVAWFDGCNTCSLGENGATICTKRACVAPAAGYCTAYAPADSTQSPATVSTTTPDEADTGILVRIWNWFKDLFGF